jgi:hypothetical protein
MWKNSKDVPKITKMLLVNLLLSFIALFVIYLKKNSSEFPIVIGDLYVCAINILSVYYFFELIKDELTSYQVFFALFEMERVNLTLLQQNEKMTAFFKIKKKCILISENSKKIIKLNTIAQIVIFLIACVLN